MKIFFLINFVFLSFIYSIFTLDRNQEDFVLKIDSGNTFSDVKNKLSQKNIFFPNLVKIVFFITNKDEDLRIGEYLFKNKDTSLEIAFKILTNDVDYRSLYIPEGSKSLDFLTKKQIESFCKYKSISECNLDGFFHPNTYVYEFYEDFNEVLNRAFNMQLSFLENYYNKNRNSLVKNSLELLIIASIIEKESCKNEMPQVAGVIYNRLRKNMKLQIDSTVIYGVENFDGNLTKKHLKTSNAYNSYLNSGLPPTPISNPSLNAIKASTYPDDHKFLYFVKKEKCLHEFSTNYKDHKAAVNKFQKNK